MVNNTINISFTGHRGDRLSLRSKSYGYDINSDENKELKKIILKKLIGLVTERNIGIKKVNIYVGGALGTDQVAFEASYALKKKLKDIDVTMRLCIPHPDFNKQWTNASKAVHERHCKLADEVVYVNTIEGYETDNLMSAYQLRNQYMINHGCDVLIAVFDGTSMSGGTYNAISYGQKVCIPIEYINLSYLNQFTNKKKASYFK